METYNTFYYSDLCSANYIVNELQKMQPHLTFKLLDFYKEDVRRYKVNKDYKECKEFATEYDFNIISEIRVFCEISYEGIYIGNFSFRESLDKVDDKLGEINKEIDTFKESATMSLRVNRKRKVYIRINEEITDNVVPLIPVRIIDSFFVKRDFFIGILYLLEDEGGSRYVEFIDSIYSIEE